MRVLLFVTDLGQGGTPLRLARLARGLRALGVDVTLGCLAPLGAVGSALACEGFQTISLGVTRPWRVDAIARLASAARRARFDLIHATLTHANVVARLAGRWAGIPVITSTATIEVERSWHLWLERLTAGWDRGHIVNSRALAEHVQSAFRIPSERLRVVSPSVRPLARLPRLDARRALRLAESAFVVAAIGRFDPVKRFDHLIRAVAHVADPRLALALAGDGPQRETLESLARSAGVFQSVRFLGWLDDPSPLYAAANLVASVSRTEGTPNVVLEALSLGVPVLAPPLPVIRELCCAGAAIQIIDGADDDDALTDALRAALRSPSRPAADAAVALPSAWVASESAAETLASYRYFLGK